MTNSLAWCARLCPFPILISPIPQPLVAGSATLRLDNDPSSRQRDPPACVLTRQAVYLQSRPKERRNSVHSGTHLRQTGGFFVPASCRYKPMQCLRREGG
uniref:Secreted protein n=1 Tax=Xanthomonas citri pv. phaseoli var. fuscans TaxID=473423 RepID=A0AB33F464_XANCI